MRVTVITVLFFLTSLLSQQVDSAHVDDRELLKWIRNKPKISTIIVEGNSYYSDEKIKSKLYSRVHTLWSSIKGDRRAYIRSETLNRDSLEIKYLYLNNGFLDIEFREFIDISDKDSSAIIKINISEGNRYLFGEKILSGEYPPKFQSDFYKIVSRLRKEKPISIFQLRQTSFELKTVLANEGYPYALVNYDVQKNSSSRITDVEFHIVSDSIVHFGDLDIEGTKEYPEYTARREVNFKSGDIYRRNNILDSQRRLFESGYFSTLQLDQQKENPDRLKPDFILKVRERKPGFVTLTTGAGQSEVKDLIWDISAGFGKRNFFGSRRYDILADYSFSLDDNVRLVTHRYRLRYTEPWFLGIRMPLLFTGEFHPRIKDPVLEYNIQEWSISISTRKKFGRKVKTVLGLEYESIEIDNIREELKADLGISVRRNIYFRYRRDSRDNIFIPRRGSLGEISGAYFGGFMGGDDSFTSLGAAWSTYQKVWPGWISASRIKSGWVEPFGKSVKVPSNDLLYLGGANSIRGFRENSLGPKGVTDIPEGSNFTLIFNQEFRWKTIQFLNIFSFMKNFPLWQSVFVDVGGGFYDPTDIKFKNLAVSYGTGIQIVSPAGPLRIDYAKVVPTERFGFDERWHFTILYAF